MNFLMVKCRKAIGRMEKNMGLAYINREMERKYLGQTNKLFSLRGKIKNSIQNFDVNVFFSFTLCYLN